MAGLVVLATALSACLSACGGGDDEPSSASRSASSSASPSYGASSSGPSDEASATSSPSRPADPVVTTYQRVRRNGKVPTSVVTAAPAPFADPVRYGDGLSLVVTGVDQATITDRGPGEFPGDPTTLISLKMTNATGSPVRLGQVVVTALYGSPRRQARPVYGEGSVDFSGVLEPGASAKAAYSFSIPKARLGQVSMYVDFDGRHTVATFQGDPRSAG